MNDVLYLRLYFQPSGASQIEHVIVELRGAVAVVLSMPSMLHFVLRVMHYMGLTRLPPG